MEFRTYRQWQVFDQGGRRKYLSEAERARLLAKTSAARSDIQVLCFVLALTGCRISEALALTPERHDLAAHTITFQTLKRRQLAFRIVPIPEHLSVMLSAMGVGAAERYWPMHRTTAWRHIKRLFTEAQITGPMACCRGFRHGFGIKAALHHVPPNLIQRWMGHALASTTAIYLDAVGVEERQFAERMW